MAVATNAEKTIRAFAACEYSHPRRKDSQFSGFWVQFAVASLAGNVQMKNTARLAVMSNADPKAQRAAVGSLPRSMNPKATLTAIAAKIATSKRAHPAYTPWTMKYESRSRPILPC